MESNESGLSSYYHHQQHQRHLPQPQLQPPHQQSPTSTATASNIVFASTSPTNGNLPNTERATHLVYPQAASVTPPAETVKRKRGRPRKYATPEEAAAAKRVVSSAAVPMSPKKKDQSFGGSSLASSSSKKTQLAALGNAGQGFTPHVISVAAGEDVYQKIMLLMQQSKCEICILSASGSISNPSLRQPATSGGNITYEGRFDIISLSGSYLCTELGGRTGGLSACLSSTDGQIIGGGIGGPLRAAGPVQVIVGRFLIETKKDVIANAGAKGDEHADNQLK